MAAEAGQHRLLCPACDWMSDEHGSSEAELRAALAAEEERVFGGIKVQHAAVAAQLRAALGPRAAPRNASETAAGEPVGLSKPQLLPREDTGVLTSHHELRVEAAAAASPSQVPVAAALDSAGQPVPRARLVATCIAKCRACLEQGRAGVLFKPEVNPLVGDSTSSRAHSARHMKDMGVTGLLPRVAVLALHTRSGSCQADGAKILARGAPALPQGAAALLVDSEVVVDVLLSNPTRHEVTVSLQEEEVGTQGVSGVLHSAVPTSVSAVLGAQDITEEAVAPEPQPPPEWGDAADVTPSVVWAAQNSAILRLPLRAIQRSDEATGEPATWGAAAASPGSPHHILLPLRITVPPTAWIAADSAGQRSKDEPLTLPLPLLFTSQG